jgi:4-hydroxy-2-oxoheptanedioate aldolase
MTGSQIRERLHEGKCVYGTHVISFMNPTAAALAAEMELDFAFICTEHIPLDRTEVGLMCRYYSARGISPIVRVPSPDPIAIATMLDGGADGIVVPYVETRAEVQEIVAAVKCRPIKGKLLRDAMEGRAEFPEKTRKFLERFNRNQYVIIGVESVPAIENLEQLITVPGVDGVFLGPHDITTSMGIPEEYENPRFLDAIESVVRRCRQHSIGVGLHYQLLKLPDRVLQRLLAAGMNWLINAADVIIMREAMNSQLRVLRQMAGDLPRAQSSAAPATAGAPVQSCLTSPEPSSKKTSSTVSEKKKSRGRAS